MRDLRQLDYFLKVVERRSITAAAADLKLTQPTLTRAIQLLEESLGVPLLERLPRGVEPTAYGAILARHARLVRVQLAGAVAEIEEARGDRAGRVAIGAGPAWLRRILPKAIAQAQAARPGIEVRLIGGFDDALLKALRQGELDLVVAELPEPAAAADLTCLPLSEDDLGVCCRAGHPLADGAEVAVEQLLPFPWLLPLGNTRARRRLEAHFLARGLPAPEPAVETDSLAFIVAALKESDALTYTTGSLLRLDEGRGLVLLPVGVMRGRRAAGVMHRGELALSPAACAIVERLTALCREDGRN